MNQRPPILFLSPPTWTTALGVMRTMARLGVRVYALKHDQLSPTTASRRCAGQVRAGVNGRPLGSPALIVEQLVEAARTLGEGTVLMPGTDEWAAFVAEHAAELAAWYRFPRPDPRLMKELTSKQGLARLAAEHGLRTPRVAVPAGRSEALAAAAEIGYPVMLKPVESRPHLVNKAVANSPEELTAAYDRVAEQDGSNVLMQEHIPGRDTDVWMFNGYFDGEGRCRFAFTAQKLRQLPVHMGNATLGVMKQNQAVRDLMVGFMESVGYRGIVDAGFRFDARDGTYKIFDVNPRVAGNYRQYLDTAGRDVVQIAYLDLIGEPVSVGGPAEGRRWISEYSDLIAMLRYRRLGELTLAGWLSSLRGVDEGALMSWRDPLPFLVAGLQLAVGTLRKRTAGRGAPASAEPAGESGSVRVA